MSWKTRANIVVNGLKQVSVEPFMFLILFGFLVRNVSIQSLFIDRACRVSLNYTDHICDHLPLHDVAQAASQKLGINFYVGVIAIATVPSIIMATFIGPWSDKYGRKTPLILTTTGLLIESVFVVILTALPDASPYLFFLAAIPAGISGGLLAAFSTVYSYMSDITDEKSRPTRYAILEFFYLLSQPFGTLIGGQVQDSGGYLAVTIISPISFACALLWVLFMVKEQKTRNPLVTKKQMVRDLFRADNVIDSVKTSIKPRPGNLRLQLWCLVSITCAITLILVGMASVGFPYTMMMYHWGVTEFSNASSIFTLLTAVATLTLVPTLNKKLEVHEAAVGLIGILSMITMLVVMSVSTIEWVYYYGWFGGIFQSCGMIGVRSRLSKLVNKNEFGRVFALLSMCESSMPLVGTIVFTQIYTSVDSFPGLSYLVGAILLIPSAVIFAWMTKLPTMSFALYQEEDAKETELKDLAQHI